MKRSLRPDEGYDKDGNFYRVPTGRIRCYRDQWIMGARQMVPVTAYEFANGDLIQGTELCQHVLEGDPFARCRECDIDLTKKACKHYKQEEIKRCGEKAWFISRIYHHTLCPEHAEEEGL